MAHIAGRNIEAPRPLKSRLSVKTNSFMLIEELIQLMENVAVTLQSGVNNTEPITQLVQNLRMHGPQLEVMSKDTLDRSFVVFRNASQDERLNIMTRLKLLELIELRAKSWEDGSNAYYKIKQANNAEADMQQQSHQQQQQHHHQQQLIDAAQAAYMSTSPTFGGVTGGIALGSTNIMTTPTFAGVGSAQQQQLLLAPGEVIRNSGKFPKPTKIPGKTYCKDEVVIRNADSGKVMGIKGRRVHMIEELSETIISFQRVNPGAKERLVQITGPTEEKINYAKNLIEDTIRRNASPVRLEGPGAPPVAGAGSCSSLASSNSDEVTPRTPGTPGVNSNLQNRLSFNSAQNFMTAQAAAQQMLIQQQQQQVVNIISNNNATTAGAGKLMRPNQQVLLHSYSTNDASLGEYKYTVNVGQHMIKITGDCCELVRMAKLVLDDYFSSREFLASVEAGAAFDSTFISPLSTPSTPLGAPPQFNMNAPLQADSGVGLNYIANQAGNNGADGDDEVFSEVNANATTPNNGLARSRRSHFSRNVETPEETAAAVAAAVGDVAAEPDNAASAGAVGKSKMPEDSAANRISYDFEHLLCYSESPHSWNFPPNWSVLCEKYPNICRNKVNYTSNNNNTGISAGASLKNATTLTATTPTVKATLMRATPFVKNASFHNMLNETRNNTFIRDNKTTNNNSYKSCFLTSNANSNNHCNNNNNNSHNNNYNSNCKYSNNSSHSNSNSNSSNHCKTHNSSNNDSNISASSSYSKDRILADNDSSAIPQTNDTVSSHKSVENSISSRLSLQSYANKHKDINMKDLWQRVFILNNEITKALEEKNSMPHENDCDSVESAVVRNRSSQQMNGNARVLRQRQCDKDDDTIGVGCSLENNKRLSNSHQNQKLREWQIQLITDIAERNSVVEVPDAMQQQQQKTQQEELLENKLEVDEVLIQNEIPQRQQIEHVNNKMPEEDISPQQTIEMEELCIVNEITESSTVRAEPQQQAIENANAYELDTVDTAATPIQQFLLLEGELPLEDYPPLPSSSSNSESESDNDM